MLVGKSTWIFLELIIFDIYRLNHKICRYWRRLYIYIYIWFHMNLIWFRLISNIIETEIFFESIFIWFFLWIEKMHCLRKGHLNPSKNLFFLKDSENIIRIKKAIWIWIFQMDSENVYLTKRPSESEFFRWIQNLYSLQKGHLNLNFSDGFRNCIPGRKAIWIHLNLNFSDGLRKCIS